MPIHWVASSSPDQLCSTLGLNSLVELGKRHVEIQYYKGIERSHERLESLSRLLRDDHHSFALI
jgi:hypothetical protein